jgi:hypothetical protein
MFAMFAEELTELHFAVAVDDDNDDVAVFV